MAAVRILLISDLPEVLELSGLGHHHPPVDAAAGEGMTLTRIRAPREGPVDGLIAGTPGDGPIVAHLSGTSERMVRVAEGLAARGIPYLFSPMSPSLPTRGERALSALAGVKSEAVRDLETAEKIAARAAAVVLAEGAESKGSRRSPGGPGAKVYLVPSPALGTDVLPEAPGDSAAGRGGPSFANLAVAFCDELAPEWNVLRLLLALERINADAVIVAGRSASPYAEECAARAASNPRVRIVAFGPGIAGDAAESARGFLRKASIVVDPSLRGLAGPVAEASARRGVPSVVSRLSVTAPRPKDVPPPGAGPFAFEPTSWELLNHAITCAFNRAAESPSGPGDGQRIDGAGADGRNTELAGILRGIYREVAAGARG